MEQKLETIPYELKRKYSSAPTVIIQARMGSSRLPGKVLIDIAGQPMLVHVVERARQSILVKEVVVATTYDPSDDPIARLCEQNNYLCYRGSPLDVLDRYFQAALTFQATNIVRLTGDCPLIDPTLIDQTVHAFLNLQPVQPTSDQFDPTQKRSEEYFHAEAPDVPIRTFRFNFAAKRFDFACTRLPPPWQRTFPIGQDIEICTFSALKRAWEESSMPYHREHVMPYLYEESRSIHFGINLGKKPAQVPDGSTLSNLPKWLTSSAPSDPNPFFVLRIDHHPDYGNLRWTVDTPEDLEYVQKILSHFCTKENGSINSDVPFRTFHYTWYDVLELIQENPGLDQTNHQSKAKDYREVDPRLNQ